MISTDELERLMTASIGNSATEPAFFRALLDATMYAHAPIYPKAERLRLVMFKSPDDGTLVVPVFTDEAKATYAARGNVYVVKVNGRVLFELTRGATVMINPNDARCTLYPEEIEQLLRDGTVVPVLKHQLQQDSGEVIIKLNVMPHALVKSLKSALAHVRGVAVAYVAGIRWPAVDQPESLLIALGGSPMDAERNVRAIATILSDQIRSFDKPVDVTHFEPSTPPAWVNDFGLQPVYRRRAHKADPSLARYN